MNNSQEPLGQNDRYDECSWIVQIQVYVPHFEDPDVIYSGPEDPRIDVINDKRFVTVNMNMRTVATYSNQSMQVISTQTTQEADDEYNRCGTLVRNLDVSNPELERTPF